MVDYQINSPCRSSKKCELIHKYCGALISKAGLGTLFDSLVDKIEGIDTTGYISYSELGINNPTGYQYGPGGWWDLEMALGQKVSVNDIFIDFGSGKGRMVYLAARNYPFKKVIGVEITEKLNNIAKKNIEKNLRKLRCKNVQLVTSDVTNYVIPNDVTVVYVYDPFVPTVFVDLMKRLRTSLNLYPREMKIIYRNPVMHGWLIENGFTVALKPDNNLSVYI
jgi:hypothetical protein